MSALHSKVILDTSATQALLAMAYQEGLLTEDADNDHCLKQLSLREFPAWLKTQTLEQIVLFEQIHMPLRFAWRGVSGELLETNQFFSLPEPRSGSGNVEAIDPAILNGILKARGITPTPFEDPSIMEKVGEALHLLEEWEKKHGEAPPSMSIHLDRIMRRQSSLEPKFAELEQIRQPLKDFEPIAAAVEQYLSTIAEAQDREAFAMSPVFDPDNNSLFQPKLNQVATNTPTTLLRLTSTKLGVLPFGQSLKDTLRMAADPATVALRRKVQEWTDSLTEDSGADTERIQREIAQALQFLEKSSVGGQISNITTYLGVPVGLIGLISSFATAMGWVCSIAGTIGLAASHVSQAKYRWATFGSCHR